MNQNRWLTSKTRHKPIPNIPRPNIRWEWGMIGVLLLAAVLRLWMLPHYPLGLHYDEAANVILTRQIAQENYRPVFIRPYTGKEVLFFYISALWSTITGGQSWAVRLSAAMLGTLTVAVTYAMARELLGREQNPRTAVYAAAWMAVIFPHILLSRYGFRAITQPLLQGLAVTAIWRGLRTRKTAWLAAGGVLTGLTAYTYLAARLFPVPLVVALDALWLQTKTMKRPELSRAFAIYLICAVISFAPLGLFFIQNPEAFGTRITQVAAPSISDALQGLWACFRALLLPGKGDPYVRFNQPGRPALDLFSAFLACGGLIVFTRQKYTSLLSRAGRILILTSIFVMLLPSALATAEITPSNLRMVGVYPFLALLPALGLNWTLSLLSPHGKGLRSAAAVLLFLILGAFAWKTYTRWSQGSALFYAADGEMVLAARAVDDEVAGGKTVYVSSEHFQHPTVAALSSQYSQVKWITGGSSFILPPSGDVIRIVPRSLQPPAPWPEYITRQIRESWLNDVEGSPAVMLQLLSEADIATIKQYSELIPAAEPAADFAHVTGVYTLSAVDRCESDQPCVITLTWKVLSSYTALQPMVRIYHPVTGEWSRAMPFHYPVSQWTPGDVILDQILLNLPPGMPPGEGYRLAVSMVDSSTQELLPRLAKEQFAGLEYSVPASKTAPWPSPPRAPLTETQIENACAGIPREQAVNLEKLRLLGWLLPTKSAVEESAQVKPGELLPVTLCWEVLSNTSTYQQVEISLQTAQDAVVLYSGTPAGGYEFEAWLPGTIVQDRYALRLPREIAEGTRMLQFRIIDDANNVETIDLATLEVLPVARTFTPPDLDFTVDAVFGSAVRLLGYDIDTQTSGEIVDITLYWQSIEPIDHDYVVFIHLVDPANGEVISQVDEQPLRGERPTSTWAGSEIIADTHRLAIPGSRPGNRYTMRTGLYIPMTGAYLMVEKARELTVEIEIP